MSSPLVQTFFVRPIGSFLTFFDGQIMSSMDSALSGLSSYVAGPLAVSAALYLLWQGIRIANGDGPPVHKFVPIFIKIAGIFWLATNLGEFDYYVRDLFYSGIPHALGLAVLGQADPTGVQSVGSAFDKIWGQIWTLYADVYAHTSMLNVSERLSALLCVLAVSIALVLMAAVFIMARFLLAIVIVFGPVMIGLLLFDTTRPIFERWVGKMVALIALQVAVIITLHIVLQGETTFVANIMGNHGLGSALSDIENLAAMVIWFAMAAFAMYALPAIAYSIGSGVSVNTLAQMGGAAMAATYLLGGGNKSEGGYRGSEPIGFPDLKIGMNRPSGGSMPRPDMSLASTGIAGMLPAPPPRPLHE